MGALLSREKGDSKDFEQVLSKLDADIQKVEGQLSEIKIKQRKASFMWTIYSLVIWIVCVVYLFYQIVSDTTTQDMMLAGVPVVLLPVGIYHVRKLLVWWYDQRQKKEEATLATLRKEQKDKLEDLKKKTSYYTTQSLLEKYDDALLKKKKEEALKQQQQQQQQQQQPRKPVSMPMRQQQPNFPANFNNGAPRPMQPNQQPILPPPRTEPQWYDKLVDALVGDAGPETKYALICTHCYNHNGLVAKEEFDTIQYICPVCKQFNPSRKSKQIMLPQQEQEGSKEKAVGKERVIPEESEESEEEEVIDKLKREYLKDEDDNTTIGSRVRKRHTTPSTTVNDTE